MEISKRKLMLIVTLISVLVAASTAAVALSTRLIFLFPQYWTVHEYSTYQVGTSGEGFGGLSVEVHSTIRQYRWIDGQKILIYSYSHPAALTQIGENFTASKISGDADWDNADYMDNVTYISVGHDVGLATTSTQLPGEWNRTSGSFEYLALGNWNYTVSFYPSGSGTTNSTGLNWESAGDNNLWAYDTFSTITYTSNDQIDVEWEIDVQYS